MVGIGGDTIPETVTITNLSSDAGIFKERGYHFGAAVENLILSTDIPNISVGTGPTQFNVVEHAIRGLFNVEPDRPLSDVGVSQASLFININVISQPPHIIGPRTEEEEAAAQHGGDDVVAEERVISRWLRTKTHVPTEGTLQDVYDWLMSQIAQITHNINEFASGKDLDVNAAILNSIHLLTTDLRDNEGANEEFIQAMREPPGPDTEEGDALLNELFNISIDPDDPFLVGCKTKGAYGFPKGWLSKSVVITPPAHQNDCFLGCLAHQFPNICVNKVVEAGYTADTDNMCYMVSLMRRVMGVEHDLPLNRKEMTHATQFFGVEVALYTFTESKKEKWDYYVKCIDNRALNVVKKDKHCCHILLVPQGVKIVYHAFVIKRLAYLLNQKR